MDCNFHRLDSPKRFSLQQLGSMKYLGSISTYLTHSSSSSLHTFCSYQWRKLPDLILESTEVATTRAYQDFRTAYFFPRSCPIRASHLPHLCSVTPRYLELPLANPVLWRRSMCTNSSLDQFLIYQHTIQSIRNHHTHTTRRREHPNTTGLVSQYTCFKSSS